jgi:DNA processing protein
MAVIDIHLLALNRITFLRPGDKLVLLAVQDSSREIFNLSLTDLEYILGRKLKSVSWRPDEYLEAAEKDRKYLTANEIGCTFYSESSYPAQLREIFDPPLLLYYRGMPLELERVFVAVVGTRRPTGLARNAAYRLGFELAAEEIITVSGLAKGIDSELHRGSVAGGGQTIGVLGNGIDSVYPSSSNPIARQMLRQGGTVISEYPPGMPPRRYNFPARNRIISGLSRAVVVVQAPERSGALITADYALEQGRDLYIHSAGLVGPSGRGSRKLFEAGAPCIDEIGDMFRDWGWDSRRNASGSIEKEARVSHNLKEKVGTRLARLMEMELSGEVERNNGEFMLKRDI